MVTETVPINLNSHIWMSLNGGDIDHSCTEQTSYPKMDSFFEGKPHPEMVWIREM